MPTVAEQLIDVLVQSGVRRIYGVVGDSLNPVVDAVRRTGGSARGGIDWIHVRNEEAGAFAAAAEAQLTGTLAVCAGSCGPGNLHLLQGVYDAHRSGAPVLAIASHIPSAQIGTGFFQETHPERLFAECSHYCEMVSSPEQMPRLARIAVQNAVGRRGAAVLVLPGDVSHESAAQPTGECWSLPSPPAILPAAADVDRLVERVNRAEKVMIMAGAGCRAAHADVLALAEAVGAPVGHSLRGKEFVQYDNPFDVGMSGLLGYGACYEAMHEADLVLLLGTDFPYDTFLPQRNTVQVDIDAARIGRRSVLEFGVLGDVGETIRAALPRLARKPDRSFLNAMLRKHERGLQRTVDTYTKDVAQQVPLHPEYVADILDEEAAEDAVFTVDTGMCNVWAARYLTPNGRRRLIGSFVHGSMANALPHAIGAQTADPGRQVVAMCGDGGLAMLLGELLTLKTHALPVKAVVFNNSSLGMVKLEMLVDGLPDFGTDHDQVDFAALAKAAGLHSRRVEKPGDVRDGIREILAHDGPAVLDVVTDPNALSIPPNITASQVRGFALAASRTVLGGGVGKMLQLAKSNLRNIPRP
ncbi:pyruvate dehydrogenase [Amycolatopsis saalfeldensis]|uniref:Pyruvate dehydrogenase (Quinone) n=1 Tax=Amycolatopsis saalfeldensis TaxID=394193 RepID=A0A1H8YKC0_9PSEU|nr:pyruvate dehydrogenase [Amycolatopsis saalfeldensis]SEP52502.1 pyruvate dehydrogenase (quinone) [Amycolatopsis saalfeldensis]